MFPVNHRARVAQWLSGLSITKKDLLTRLVELKLWRKFIPSKQSTKKTDHYMPLVQTANSLEVAYPQTLPAMPEVFPEVHDAANLLKVFCADSASQINTDVLVGALEGAAQALRPSGPGSRIHNAFAFIFIFRILMEVPN